ncbi:hypothetical protein V6N11_083205 [Hibiscus sabdariffa]|uniref:RNase H type-1 domain-containing protein n=1 Tax=Hibiscus sabdariffa TaxID=183260 RepID=A0ABR2QL87_9ROSI
MNDLLKWQAPPRDCLCLNTDVAVSFPGRLGVIGGVLRDYSGVWIKAARLSVQSDSSVAIRVILDPLAMTSSLPLPRAIALFSNRDWSIDFIWVPREHNMVADGLSKLSPPPDYQLETFDDVPESILPFLVRDRDGPPYCRRSSVASSSSYVLS